MSPPGMNTGIPAKPVPAAKSSASPRIERKTMSEALQKSTDSSQFTLVSIEKTDPPQGCDGDKWYRYVIERGISTIVGNRSGTLKQVTNYAREYTAELNERAKNGGRSSWSPRSKQKSK